MHASRACLVSGQQQHIFLPDLIPSFWVEAHLVSSVAGAGADEEFPIAWMGGGEKKRRLKVERRKDLQLPMLFMNYNYDLLMNHFNNR
jgi:hypothetical protein